MVKDTDCKSVGRLPSWVQIPPSPPCICWSSSTSEQVTLNHQDVGSSPTSSTNYAEVVERHTRLPQKSPSINAHVGSNPTLSTNYLADVMQTEDMAVLEIAERNCSCGFNSHHRHHIVGGIEQSGSS